MASTNSKLCSALDEIAKIKPEEKASLASISSVSDDEKGILLNMLSFFGVVSVEDDEFEICSESAKLFIQSFCAFLRQGGKLFHTGANSSISDKLNEANMFALSNFLAAMERRRQKVCSNSDDFCPIISEALVRAVIVRQIWWKKYYLMQYSDKVGAYQLIGGICPADSDEKGSMISKIKDEIPEIFDFIDTDSLKEIFVSMRTDEEVFFSRRFGVFARYKTRIFSVPARIDISKDTLKELNDCKKNRWVSLKEIEKGMAYDGKKIFTLAPNIIAEIKKLDANVLVKKYDINTLLEKPLLKLLLAISGLAGLAALIKPVIEFFGRLFL